MALKTSSDSIGNIPASMRLQHLQNEPQRLADEAERLNNELDMLVMDNYRVFVENLTCSVFLRNEDKKLSEYSSSLADHLEKLALKCGTFRERVNQYISSHKRNRKTLKHNMQLIELLEIPQLVDACARNGFHDEALDLAAFVNGLERKHLFAAEVRQSTSDTQHRKGNSVVRSMVNDVHATLADLRRQLLVRLSEESSLPKLLQTLTALRRLDGILVDRQLSALSATDRDKETSVNDSERVRSDLMRRVETALQMNFLEARSLWVLTQLEDVVKRRHTSASGGRPGVDDPSGGRANSGTGGASVMLGPYGRGIELLEMYRSSWFSVVSQYSALFASSNGEYPPASLLAFWIEDQLDTLLAELSYSLQSIEEGPSVRSLLEQCLLFSDRMREVGCDFKERILPVFEQAVVWRVDSLWSKGLSNFKQIVVTERFVTRGQIAADGADHDDDFRAEMGEQVIPLYMHQDKVDPEMQDTPSKSPRGDRGTTPPAALMAYPALAYLLNSLLIGLNFLKDTPLIAAQERILAQLELVLEDVCKFVVSVSDDIRIIGKKYFSSSAELAAAAGGSLPGCMDRVYANVISDELVVHALRCFQFIYHGVEAESSPNGDDAGRKTLHQDLQSIADSCRSTFIAAGLIDAAVTAPAKTVDVISKVSVGVEESNRDNTVEIEKNIVDEEAGGQSKPPVNMTI